MNQRTYFIYLYYWDDGDFYIGRTFEGSNRYGNIEGYKDQYVYKKMVKETPHTVKIYEDTNPVKVYHIEHELITSYLYTEGNLNAKAEDNWFQTFMRTFAVKDVDPDSILWYMTDYAIWIDLFSDKDEMDIFQEVAKWIKK